jgi:hypothetical protein
MALADAPIDSAMALTATLTTSLDSAMVLAYAHMAVFITIIESIRKQHCIAVYLAADPTIRAIELTVLLTALLIFFLFLLFRFCRSRARYYGLVVILFVQIWMVWLPSQATEQLATAIGGYWKLRVTLLLLFCMAIARVCTNYCRTGVFRVFGAGFENDPMMRGLDRLRRERELDELEDEQEDEEEEDYDGDEDDEEGGDDEGSSDSDSGGKQESGNAGTTETAEGDDGEKTEENEGEKNKKDEPLKPKVQPRPPRVTFNPTVLVHSAPSTPNSTPAGSSNPETDPSGTQDPSPQKDDNGAGPSQQPGLPASLLQGPKADPKKWAEEQKPGATAPSEAKAPVNPTAPASAIAQGPGAKAPSKAKEPENPTAPASAIAQGPGAKAPSEAKGPENPTAPASAIAQGPGAKAPSKAKGPKNPTAPVSGPASRTRSKSKVPENPTAPASDSAQGNPSDGGTSDPKGDGNKGKSRKPKG